MTTITGLRHKDILVLRARSPSTWLVGVAGPGGVVHFPEHTPINTGSEETAMSGHVIREGYCDGFLTLRLGIDEQGWRCHLDIDDDDLRGPDRGLKGFSTKQLEEELVSRDDREA